jgi:hypothetical protein
MPDDSHTSKEQRSGYGRPPTTRRTDAARLGNLA